MYRNFHDRASSANWSTVIVGSAPMNPPMAITGSPVWMIKGDTSWLFWDAMRYFSPW